MIGPFYPNLLPQAGDLLLGQIIEFDQGKVTVSLHEYEGQHGHVFIKSARKRQLKNMVKIGKEDVFKVIDADADKQLVTLEMRDVDDKDREMAKNRYQLLRHLRSITTGIGRRLEYDAEASKHLYNQAFEWLIGDAEQVSELDHHVLYERLLTEKIAELERDIQQIIEDFRQRYAPSSFKVAGAMAVNSFTPEGIDAIREVMVSELERANREKPPGVTDVSVVLDTAPTYRVQCVARDEATAVDVATQLTQSIGTAITKRGGRFRITENPTKVSFSM